MIRTLRGYLKHINGINYRNFRIQYGKNIRELPVTFKVLMRRNAGHHDEIDLELKEQGWLLPNENLFEIFSQENLSRMKKGKMEYYEYDIQEIQEWEPTCPEDLIPLHEIILHCP